MKGEWPLKVGGMAKAIIPIIILRMDRLRITNYLMIQGFHCSKDILGNPKPNYPSHAHDIRRAP
jgi:hypothetical protein